MDNTLDLILKSSIFTAVAGFVTILVKQLITKYAEQKLTKLEKREENDIELEKLVKIKDIEKNEKKEANDIELEKIFKLKTAEKRWEIYPIFFESAYRIKNKLSDIKKTIDSKEFQEFYEKNKAKSISALKHELLMKKLLLELDELTPLTVLFRQELFSKRIFIDSQIFKLLHKLASCFKFIQNYEGLEEDNLELFYMAFYEMQLENVSEIFEKLEILMKQDMLKFKDEK